MKSPGAVLVHRAVVGHSDTAPAARVSVLCGRTGTCFSFSDCCVCWAEFEKRVVQTGLRVGALLTLIRCDSESHGE